MTEVLHVKKVADKSPEAMASHPAGHPDKYPFAGLDVVDVRGRPADPPKSTRVSTGFVDKARAEGWIELEGEEVHHRPGGPPDDLWRVTHTFKHADTIVLKTRDGDVRYTVTHQPDKYVDSTDYSQEGLIEGGTEVVGSRNEADDVEVTDEHYAAGQTRVDHFYDLELEG